MTSGTVTSALAKVDILLAKTRHDTLHQKRERARKSWWRAQAFPIIASALVTQTANCGYQGYTKREERQYAECRQLVGQVVPLLNDCLTLANSAAQAVMIATVPPATTALFRSVDAKIVAEQMTALGRRIGALTIHSSAVFDPVTSQNLSVIGREVDFIGSRLAAPLRGRAENKSAALHDLAAAANRVSWSCASLEYDMLMSVMK